MSKKIKIDQFLDIDRLDNVRKELTLKFDKFDEKIDSKLSAKLFFTDWSFYNYSRRYIHLFFFAD